MPKVWLPYPDTCKSPSPPPSADAGALAPSACGNTLVAEFETFRLLAGCAETSPAKTYVALSPIISRAVATTPANFPAPPDTQSLEQTLNLMTSSLRATRPLPAVPTADTDSNAH